MGFAYPHMGFEFESWIQTNLMKIVASCISSNHNILPCHDHASYCCIALIVFFLVCRCLSPLSRRGSDDEFDDTYEELSYLQKCQASNPPLSIPIQSHSLALSLFYYIDNNDSTITCCSSRTNSSA